MALQVAVDVGLVAAHSLAKVLGRNAALVFDVTFEAVFPLVVAAARLALPGLGIVLMLEYDLVLLADAARSVVGGRSHGRGAAVEARVRAGPRGLFLGRRGDEACAERGRRLLGRDPDSPPLRSRSRRGLGRLAAPNRYVRGGLRLRRAPGGRVHGLIGHGDKVRVRPEIKTFELDLSVTATQ